MSENNLSMRDQLEKELEEATQGVLLSDEVRRKKLIIYVIRTTLAALLYYLLWKYYWVRMSLWLYIPLNLTGLLSITLMPIILQRKVDKTKAIIGNFPEESDYEEE